MPSEDLYWGTIEQELHLERIKLKFNTGNSTLPRPLSVSITLAMCLLTCVWFFGSCLAGFFVLLPKTVESFSSLFLFSFIFFILITFLPSFTLARIAEKFLDMGVPKPAFYNRLMHPPILIELTPTTCQIREHRIAWGDVSLIINRPCFSLSYANAQALVFVLDDGTEMPFRMPGYHVSTLSSHLYMRLQQLAPGSPSDVPEALDSLRGGLT